MGNMLVFLKYKNAIFTLRNFVSIDVVHMHLNLKISCEF